MSAPASQAQWYLARDGQQFGPLSERELAKFVELGHLQPNDLLWREGFPDWRPALVVFPPRKVAAPPVASMRAPAPAGHAPRREPAPAHQAKPRPAPAFAGPPEGQAERRRFAEVEEPEERGGVLKKVLLAVICLAVIGAAGWYAYPLRDSLMEFAKTLPSRVTGSLAGLRTGDATPKLGGSAQSIDAALQALPVWRIVKRDFPDWYAARLKEAATLAAQNKDEAAIGQHVARALVALRRENAKHALAASAPRLKAVASAFHENLVQLRKLNPQACAEFITRGEASPQVLALMQSSAHVDRLQAQLTAVFEAVADGRGSPRVYPRPSRADYDFLLADLTKRGWSEADQRLFQDLPSAGPDKICQLLHDWFGAQLAIADPGLQLRLLVESLGPLFAG